MIEKWLIVYVVKDFTTDKKKKLQLESVTWIWMFCVTLLTVKEQGFFFYQEKDELLLR